MELGKLSVRLSLLHFPTCVPNIVKLFLEHHYIKPCDFQTMVVLGWLVALTLAVSSMFGISYFNRDEQVVQYNALQSSSYISLHRVAWALAVAWLIFACETGHGGCLKTIFNVIFISITYGFSLVMVLIELNEENEVHGVKLLL
jgi:hypothetical protein